MARPLDHDKRVELLGRVVEYIGTHGLDDLTLRPLAAELGTSSRMLIYYFDSRENLIVQALSSQRPAFDEMFGDVHDYAQLEQRLHHLWTSMSDGKDVVSSRILMQVIGIASIKSGVLADFARDSVRALTDALAAAMARCGMDSATASMHATALGAGFRGLLLDRFTTGDSERTDAAADVLFRAATRPRSL
ncbi:TetR family transcriptional regulator [Rhodococcus sp. Leaf278]|uniref:TetR family transcriptional regulator n=1 Tax=Rhodococcus sp. Leaf278 TaxID=1736319 RepID=UPI00070FF3C0|nr:TetR family transcriptional regulator [Rhodococcus sp. Leaf278]KQU49360.1 TetR family transcriptional regulator [Rhodococcus sp. Leaf278]